MPVRVMIVDDHLDVRYLMRAAVEDAPEDVEIVAEAADAAGALDRRHPALPIVLCTGVVDDAVHAAAEAVGITACLSKDDFERIATLAAGLAGGAAA